MSNTVFNHLRINGSKNEIGKFTTDNSANIETNGRTEKLSFLKSVNGDGTEDSAWRIHNWGCNSDAEYVTCMYESKPYQEYYFMTKSAPPLQWLTKVSVLYPKLSFYLRFHHETFEFFAFVQAKNGVVTYLDNYTQNDIFTYLIKTNDVYPQDLIKLAVESGLAKEVPVPTNPVSHADNQETMVVCYEPNEIDYKYFEKVVDDYLYHLNSPYELNVKVMRTLMQRILSQPTES